MSKSLFIFFLFSSVAQASSQPVDSLLNIINQTSNDSAKAITYLELISLADNDVYLRSQYFDSALKYAQSAENVQIIAAINLAIGNELKNRDYYDSARGYLTEALLHFEQVHDTLGIANTWNSIGYTYAYQAYYDAALNSFLKGLEFAQEIEKIILKGRTLNNIGAVYEHINDKDQALQYYKRAYHQYLKEIDPREIALTAANIGKIYYEMSSFDSAKYFLQISREYALADNNILQLSLTNSIFSLVFSKENNWDEAKRYGLEAISQSKKIDSKKGLAISNYQFAQILFDKQKYNLSREHLNTALFYTESAGMNDYSMRAYQLKAKVDSASGEFRSAFDNYQKYIRLKDAIANSEVEKQIASLQSNFDLQLKEKENALLKEEAFRKENVIKNQRLLTLFIVSVLFMAIVLVVLFIVISNQRKKHNIKLTSLLSSLKDQKIQLETANNSLSELNVNKNRLLSVIAHDLKGPVGNLESLLDIMIGDFDLTDTKELSVYLKMMHKSASSTYVLLENLLSWARSQQNEIVYNPEQLALDQMVQSIKDLLSQLSPEKQINIVNNVPMDTTVFADKNMMMVVLRNLISNALKFSHEEGVVEVFAESEGNQKRITIKDEGIGMSSEVAEKVFESGELYSRRGTNGESGSGLGLKLCKEFVGKHGGHIWVESEVGRGSSFCFTIPQKN